MTSFYVRTHYYCLVLQPKMVLITFSVGHGVVKMSNAQFNDKILGQKLETQVQFNELTTPH